MISYVTIYRKYCNKTSETNLSQMIREMSLKYQWWAVSQTEVQAIFEILQLEITQTPKPLDFRHNN